MTLIRQHFFTKHTSIFFCVALVSCFLLNIGVFKDFIFLDANEYLYTANRKPNFQDEFIEGGRPFLGLYYKFIYGLTQTVANLKWIRAITLVFSVTFSTQVFYYLVQLNYKFFESAIFALLILALPSFTVYYSWSDVSEIPILLSICFFIGSLLIKNHENNKTNIAVVFFSVMALIITLMTYQPAAMAIVLPLVLKSITRKEIDLNATKKIILVTATSFIIYYVVFKLSLYFYDLQPKERTSVNAFNSLKKTVKFFLFEIRTLLKNSGFLIASKLFLFLGIFSLIGFIFLVKKQFKKPLIFILFLILILPFSYAPNILSGQNFFSLRTIAPTAIIILFYQFYFLRQLSLNFAWSKHIILGLALTLMIMSSINIHKYIVNIQHKEYKTSRTLFRSVDIDVKEPVIIVIPQYGFLKNIGYIDKQFSDEFGNLSAVKEWSSKYLFSQIAWETSKINDKTIHVFDPKCISVTAKDSINNKHNKRIINLSEALKYTFER